MRKRPGHPKAETHVSSIVDKRMRLGSLPLDTPSTSRDGSSVVIDFVYGPTVDDLYLQRLLDLDFSGALAILEAHAAWIGHLPTTMTNPCDAPDFVDVFGSAFAGPGRCINLGLIDLGLDNLIVQDDRTYLVDWEWLFDFPLPRALILGRFLLEHCTRYRSIFAALASTRFHLVELANGLLAPEELYERCRSHFEGLPQVVQAESRFQTYVTGSSALRPMPSSEIVRVHRSRIDRTPIAELGQLRSRVEELERELRTVYGSKTWRAGSLLARPNRGLRTLFRR